MSDPTLAELTADLADARAREVLPTWFGVPDVVEWYGCGLREARALIRVALAAGVVRNGGRDANFRPLYCRAGDPAASDL